MLNKNIIPAQRVQVRHEVTFKDCHHENKLKLAVSLGVIIKK